MSLALAQHQDHVILKGNVMALWVPGDREYAETMDGFIQQSTGLIIPKHVVEIQKRPIAIDLFAGAGGFSLGIMKAGFEVMAAADYDASAAVTYCYNLGAYPMRIEGVEEPGDLQRLEKELRKQMGYDDKTGKVRKAFITGGSWKSGHSDVPGVSVFFLGDIRKLTGERILKAISRERGEVDLVVGGPPCQGFSIAGKRDVMDPRNSLIFDYARLLLEIDPKTFVMENVPGIIGMMTPEGVPVMDAFCHIMEEGGWGSYDLLKKSLALSAGVGGAMKSRNPRKRKKKDKKKKESKKVMQQPTLL